MGWGCGLVQVVLYILEQQTETKSAPHTHSMSCKIVVKEPPSYKKRGDVDFCKLASTTEQKISDTNAFKNRGLPKKFCRQKDA